MPGGLNEYDPQQLGDLEPIVIETMALVNLDDSLELKAIRFAQVQSAVTDDVGSTYIIFAELKQRILSEKHALCRLIANDRPKGGLEVLAADEHVSSNHNNSNQIDSADYEEVSQRHGE